MAVKVAINGFGRIGRLVFRAMVEQGLVGKDVQVVAVGDIVPADNLAYLLKYDSIQGRFNGTVGSEKSAADKPDDDVLIVNGQKMQVVSAKDPSQLPWKQLGVDVKTSDDLLPGSLLGKRSFFSQRLSADGERRSVSVARVNQSLGK